MVLRNNTKLYLSLQFPITTHGKLFHTYKIHSFPVEINQNSNHATQLLDLPEYFLITKDNKFYTTLTSNQFDKCQFIIQSTVNLILYLNPLISLNALFTFL